MSEGQTCYERDEVLCDDQMCLRTGCRIRNERMAADAALLRGNEREGRAAGLTDEVTLEFPLDAGLHNLVFPEPRTESDNGLTGAQLGWLAAHPQYCFPGPPRPGLRFHECGTLYVDGTFELMAPMKAAKLKDGCRLVGIPSDLYLTGAPEHEGMAAGEVSKLSETLEGDLDGLQRRVDRLKRFAEMDVPPILIRKEAELIEQHIAKARLRSLSGNAVAMREALKSTRPIIHDLSVTSRDPEYKDVLAKVDVALAAAPQAQWDEGGHEGDYHDGERD